MEKLELYNKVREVPQNAQKPIKGGRLSGMTDINPMWRIKTLTEQFGACGQGWYYEIADKWTDTGTSQGEVVVNVTINLYVKYDDEWSKPIVGIGGSQLIQKERNGLYVNDEAYKMALTDAISVACKSLGVGADIYWGADNTKYNDVKKSNYDNNKPKDNVQDLDAPLTAEQLNILEHWYRGDQKQIDFLKDHYNVLSVNLLSIRQAGELIATIRKQEGKNG